MGVVSLPSEEQLREHYGRGAEGVASRLGPLQMIDLRGRTQHTAPNFLHDRMRLRSPKFLSDTTLGFVDQTNINGFWKAAIAIGDDGIVRHGALSRLEDFPFSRLWSGFASFSMREDNDILAFAGIRDVIICDSVQNECVARPFPDDAVDVKDAAFTSDGKLVLSHGYGNSRGSSNGFLSVFDLSNCNRVSDIPMHPRILRFDFFMRFSYCMISLPRRTATVAIRHALPDDDYEEGTTAFIFRIIAPTLRVVDLDRGVLVPGGWDDDTLWQLLA